MRYLTTILLLVLLYGGNVHSKVKVKDEGKGKGKGKDKIQVQNKVQSQDKDKEQEQEQEQGPAKTINQPIDPEKEFKLNLSEMYKRVGKSIKILREQITENQNAPFLPNLYYQLGGLLSQKANVEYYIHKENEGSSDTTTVTANKKFNQVVITKQEAIEVYKKIIDEFPNFDKKAETLYALALTLQSIDEIPSFMQYARELIAKYPGKEESIRAQLLMGQHFFDRQEYDTALNTLFPLVNSTYIYERNVARYRVGLIYITNSKFKNALEFFEQVITDVQLKDSDSPFEVSLKQKSVKSSLKREALIDSIRAYTEINVKDAKPIEYYSKIAPTENLFQEVIEKLAFRYIHLKRFDSAIELLRTLSERTILPEKVINIYQEVLIMIPIKDRVDLPVEEIRYLLTVYNRWINFYNVPKNFKDQSYSFFEKQIRDLGTRAHLYIKTHKSSATESKVKPLKSTIVNDIVGGKSNIEVYNLQDDKMKYYAQKAIDYYQLYLAYFNKSPNAVKIAMNMGDVYYNMKDYLHSGDYYLRTYLGEFGRPSDKRNLIENALLCFQQTSDFSFYELLRIKGLLIKSLNIYMSMDTKLKNDPKLNFILAKSVYEQGFYDRALGDLLKFMSRFHGTKYATSAGDMILDYFNTKSDFDGLVEWSGKILATGISNKNFIAKVNQIREQARLKKLQSQVEASGSFDTFSQGKSYLETALLQKDAGMMNIALQNALSKSKREKDLDTFLQTAQILASKEKNSSKKADILFSAIQEQVRITRFHDAYKSLRTIYSDKTFKVDTRQLAYNQLVGLAITLKDWRTIIEVANVPFFTSLSSDVKRRLVEQVADLLESPIVLPSGLDNIIRKIGITNEVSVGLFKAQNRLSKGLKSLLASSIGKCHSSMSPVCKWNQLTKLDQLSLGFQEKLVQAPKTIESVQKQATPLQDILQQYSQVGQSDDAQLNILVAMKTADLYQSFGKFLQIVAMKNPSIKTMLLANADGSFKNAMDARNSCKKTMRNLEIITPANRYCVQGKSPSLSKGIFWSQTQPMPTITSTNDQKYLPEMKSIFAAEKGDYSSTLNLAKSYFDAKLYALAAATGRIGMGIPGAGSDFSTIIGCSVLQLGHLNEAQYFLSKGNNFPEIKNSCQKQLKQLEVSL